MASDVGKRQAIFGARHRHITCNVLDFDPSALTRDRHAGPTEVAPGARSCDPPVWLIPGPPGAVAARRHSSSVTSQMQISCLIRYASNQPRWTPKIESETPSSKSIAKILFVLVDAHTFLYIAAFHFIWTKRSTGMISLTHGFARAISTAGTKLFHASTPSRQAPIPPAHVRPSPLCQIIA